MTALIQHGSALFRDYSLEITGKDIWQIEAAKSEIPAGTPINIAYLGNETTRNASRRLRVSGNGASSLSPSFRPGG